MFIFYLPNCMCVYKGLRFVQMKRVVFFVQMRFSKKERKRVYAGNNNNK